MRRDVLGEVEHLILLAIVRLGDTAYGVTIRQEIEQRTGRDLAIGALYTALERLERKGFVRSSLSDPTPERGGRSKRHYRLKAAGASALRQSRERLVRMWAGVSTDLRKVGS
jgi:PadR family transcriptional regulator, regulatory protein PadR